MNSSIGVGLATPGPLEATACNIARKSSGVATGKLLAEMLTMSVLAPSGRSNRMAMPCGLACGSASGMLGTPVGSEKRTMTGTGLAKCGALLNSDAPLKGVNIPASKMPLAWFARYPACGPPEILLKVSTKATDSGLDSAGAASAAGLRRPQEPARRYHLRRPRVRAQGDR